MLSAASGRAEEGTGLQVPGPRKTPAEKLECLGLGKQLPERRSQPRWKPAGRDEHMVLGPSPVPGSWQTPVRQPCASTSAQVHPAVVVFWRIPTLVSNISPRYAWSQRKQEAAAPGGGEAPCPGSAPAFLCRACPSLTLGGSLPPQGTGTALC